MPHLANIDALGDLVRVLLDAGRESEHGGVLVSAGNHPLLGLADWNAGVVLRHRIADAVGRENPAIDARLLRNAAASAALAVHMRADDAPVSRHRRPDRGMLLWRDPAQIDLRIVEDVALPAGVRIDRHADLDFKACGARVGD